MKTSRTRGGVLLFSVPVMVLLALGCGAAPTPQLTAGTSEADTETAGRTYASIVAEGDGVDDPQPQPGIGVMEIKLQEAIAALSAPSLGNEVHLAAVDQVMESLFMSNLVLLPTGNVPEVEPAFADHIEMMNRAIGALSQHIQQPELGSDGSKSAAFEARNFIQIFREASEVVAGMTANCDPLNLGTAECAPLQANDEGGVVVDSIYPGFSRQVRSPFFVGAPSPVIQEQVIVSEPIADGECHVILKEIQGIKAIIRPVLIPIWVEPWFARASIVGYRTVWVWEFVPAEFLKTISYCNNAGTIAQDVEIITVVERQLMHFWSFMRKDISLHP